MAKSHLKLVAPTEVNRTVAPSGAPGFEVRRSDAGSPGEVETLVEAAKVKPARAPRGDDGAAEIAAPPAATYASQQLRHRRQVSPTYRCRQRSLSRLCSRL